MYKIEVAFNERWSCTYNRKSKKKMPKVSAFWETRPSAILYPLPHVLDQVFYRITI